MKAALKNDWYLLRYLLPIILLISVLSVWIYTITPDEVFLSLAFPLLFTSFIPTALYLTDERSRWGGFLVGLPGRRSAYIHAKYITGIMSIIIVFAVSVICNCLGIVVTGKNELNEQVTVFMLGFSAAVIMCSVFLPIMTRFGARVGIVVYFIMMFLLGIISGYFEAMIEDGEAAVPGFIFSLTVMGTAVIVYLLSWLVSLHIYKHKDL